MKNDNNWALHATPPATTGHAVGPASSTSTKSLSGMITMTELESSGSSWAGTSQWHSLSNSSIATGQQKLPAKSRHHQQHALPAPLDPALLHMASTPSPGQVMRRASNNSMTNPVQGFAAPGTGPSPISSTTLPPLSQPQLPELRMDTQAILAAERQRRKLIIQERNVYISGLPTDFRPSALRAMCEVYGRIESSKLCMEDNEMICTCKGYGFVLFKDVESAASCIQSLSGSVLAGKQLQVRRADLSAAPQPTYPHNANTNTTSTTNSSTSTIPTPTAMANGEKDQMSSLHPGLPQSTHSRDSLSSTDTDHSHPSHLGWSNEGGYVVTSPSTLYPLFPTYSMLPQSDSPVFHPASKISGGGVGREGLPATPSLVMPSNTQQALFLQTPAGSGLLTAPSTLTNSADTLPGVMTSASINAYGPLTATPYNMTTGLPDTRYSSTLGPLFVTEPAQVGAVGATPLSAAQQHTHFYLSSAPRPEPATDDWPTYSEAVTPPRPLQAAVPSPVVLQPQPQSSTTQSSALLHGYLYYPMQL